MTEYHVTASRLPNRVDFLNDFCGLLDIQALATLYDLIPQHIREKLQTGEDGICHCGGEHFISIAVGDETEHLCLYCGGIKEE